MHDIYNNNNFYYSIISYYRSLTIWGLSTRYGFGAMFVMTGQLSSFDEGAWIHLSEMFEFLHSVWTKHLFSTTHQPHSGLLLPRQLEQLGWALQLTTGTRITCIKSVVLLLYCYWYCWISLFLIMIHLNWKGDCNIFKDYNINF